MNRSGRARFQPPSRSWRDACAVGLIVVAAALTGCTTHRSLPVAGFPNHCRGVGIEAVLAGSANDPRVTWIQAAQGAQLSLVWPPGWTAQFNPDLEVLDDQGVIRMRAGDPVSGICQKGTVANPSGVVMIEGLLNSQ